MSTFRSVEIHVPRESDGHEHIRSLQWTLMCPHMGSSEVRMFQVLVNLTAENSVTETSLYELSRLVPKGPVAPGEDPKFMSASGVARILSALGALGQISTPNGKPLSVSNSKTGRLRFTVLATPGHKCEGPKIVKEAVAALPDPEPRVLCTYAIGDPATGFLKIGYAASLRSRLGQIQVGYPGELSIMWHAQGGADLEDHLHCAFKDRRIRGEWFDFSDCDAASELSREAARFAEATR